MPTDFDYRVAFGFPGLTNVGIARGTFADLESVHKFGGNDAVTTTETDIWAGGGKYPWPESAQTLHVASGGSEDDKAGGVGARELTVIGLDTNWLPTSATITLAGSAASAATTQTFRRVWRAFVTDVGTYTGTNVGTTVIQNQSSQILCQIGPGMGQTQLSQYTVPASTDAYLVRMAVQVDGAQAANVKMWQRQNADVVAAPFTGYRVISVIDGLAGEFREEFAAPVPFPPLTDLWFTGEAKASTTAVDVNYDLVLVRPM